MQRSTFPWRILDEKSPPSKDKLDAAASAISTTSPQICFLTRLPPQLKVQVFNCLDPVTSICFGLTCKEMYGFHRQLYPHPIPLFWYNIHEGVVQYLTALLYTWFGPDWIMVVKQSKRYNAKAVTLRRMPAWVKEGLEKREWDEGRGWCFTEVDMDGWNIMNWIQASVASRRPGGYASLYEK